MPKKKAEFAQDAKNEDEDVVEVWDIRKIGIGIVILVLLIFAGIVTKRILLHESLAPSTFVPPLPSVKGISDFLGGNTSNNPSVHISLPSQEDVQNKIQEIQQQVTHLDVNDIATSSPQVQQILEQLQQIPAGPVGQVKEACMRLCNQL